MINNLKDLLIKELRDLHDAEVRIVAALATYANAAQDNGAMEGLSELRHQSEKHALRVTEACEHLGASAQGEVCEATRGLVRELDGLMSEEAEASVRDAALLSGLQRIAHYKIAGYGSALNFAENLDLDDVATNLRANLDESLAVQNQLKKAAAGGILSHGVNQDAART